MIRQTTPEQLNNAGVEALHDGNVEYAAAIIRDALRLQACRLSPCPPIASIAQHNSPPPQQQQQQQQQQHNINNNSHCCAPSIPASDEEYDRDEIYCSKELLMKRLAEEERHAAFLFGRGMPLGYLAGLNEDSVAAIQSATILYNMGLAQHKKAIYQGFNNTLQGAILIKKALQFYSMSLELVNTMIASGVFQLVPLAYRRVVVGLVNNMGQIHYSIGNDNLAQQFFHHSLSHLTDICNTKAIKTCTQEEMDEDEDEDELFAPKDMAGLVFNATALITRRSERFSPAAAA